MTHSPCDVYSVESNVRNGTQITWGCGLTHWVFVNTPFHPTPEQARILHDQRTTRPPC